MCVNQGYIRKLDDSIIFNLTISDENKTRVAEAYKKGAVEETKKDEPMYNQHAQADVNWVEQLKRKYLNNTSVQPTPPSTEMETDEPESSAMVYIYKK
jgi:hypothetical protein